jgi:hypothetical protein
MSTGGSTAAASNDSGTETRVRRRRHARDWRGGRAPLLARIGDLGPGDFLKVDCGACQHTALLTREFLDRHGLEPHRKVLDLKDQVRRRGCGVRGRAVVSIKWAKSPA